LLLTGEGERIIDNPVKDSGRTESDPTDYKKRNIELQQEIKWLKSQIVS